MPSGELLVKTFVSYAFVPLQGAVIYIMGKNEEKLGVDVTNKVGEISPIVINAPSEQLSEEPTSISEPFSVVDVYAYKQNYYLIKVENVQIFDNVMSVQSIQMIPLPDNMKTTELKTIVISSQDLSSESNLGG